MMALSMDVVYYILVCSVLLVFIIVIMRNLPGKVVPGELKYGWGLLVLGFLNVGILVFLIFSFFISSRLSDPVQFNSAIMAISLFAFSSLYTLGENSSTYGRFDGDGIHYHTLWTGTKNEKWSDLKKVKFNAIASWLVLRFESGKVVRISTMMGGYEDIEGWLQSMK